MSAAYVRAGNCWEHSIVAAHLSARRLQEENNSLDSVAKVESKVVDHCWSEQRQGDTKMRESDIIMDPWAEGPAIERRDSEYARSHIIKKYHFRTGEMPTANFRDITPSDSAKDVAHKEYDKLQTLTYEYQPEEKCEPEDALSEEFHESYESAIHRRGHLDDRQRALLNDIHKVGVLYTAGASIKTANAQKSSAFSDD